MANNRKLMINEDQEKNLILHLKSGMFPVNPEKVLIVKKFLDGNFKKGYLDRIGNNGFPEKVIVYSMIDSNGEPLRNFIEDQMVELLVEKFKKMFSNKEEREKFLKQVLKDWLNDRIGSLGNLSVNAV